MGWTSSINFQKKQKKKHTCYIIMPLYLTTINMSMRTVDPNLIVIMIMLYSGPGQRPFYCKIINNTSFGRCYATATGSKVRKGHLNSYVKLNFAKQYLFFKQTNKFYRFMTLQPKKKQLKERNPRGTQTVNCRYFPCPSLISAASIYSN